MTFLSDVEKLKTNPTADTRKLITESITQYFNQGVFDQAETKLAIEVMTLLAHDAEMHVRMILSENLKHNNNIPHELALRLSHDVVEVSLPMLEFSSLLSQEELIAIVHGLKEIAPLLAIARRNDITKPLTSALIDTSNEQVVCTLITNRRAEITENHMQNVLSKFPTSSNVMEALIDRKSLPVSIIEQMLEFVSGELKNQLVKQYHLPESIASDIALETHEQSTLDLLSVSDDNVVQGLVDYLHKNNTLTPSIVLRALCKGDLNFFEMGMAKLAGMTLDKVREILHVQGAATFAPIYKKAGMPKGAFAAVNIIWKFALNELNSGTFEKATYPNRVIEHITQNGYDKKINIMEYFMVLVKCKIADDDIVYRKRK